MSRGLVAPYREIRSCNGRIKRTEKALQKAGQKSGAARFLAKISNIQQGMSKGISNIQQGMSNVQICVTE